MLKAFSLRLTVLKFCFFCPENIPEPKQKTELLEGSSKRYCSWWGFPV